MTIPSIAPIRDQSELTRVSRCLLHFRASDCLNEAIGGQAATFARGTVVTIADEALNTFDIGYTQPAWETLTWQGGAQSMFLRMGTDDRFHFAADWRPQAFGFYHEFRQNGAMASSGKALWSISNDGTTNARFRMYSNGTQYTIEHHNGTTARDQSVATAPSSGDSVVQWGYLYSDGSVQFWQAINGNAAVASVLTSTSSLASAWGATPRVRLSAWGTSAGAGAFHRVFKLIPGVPTLAQMEEAF